MPTINIIGCAKELATKFSRVFGIDGNGFDGLKEFIGAEFRSHPDLFRLLVENYTIKDDARPQ